MHGEVPKQLWAKTTIRNKRRVYIAGLIVIALLAATVYYFTGTTEQQRQSAKNGADDAGERKNPQQVNRQTKFGLAIAVGPCLQRRRYHRPSQKSKRGDRQKIGHFGQRYDGATPDQ